MRQVKVHENTALAQYRGLSKHYGKRQIFNDVDLDLHRAKSHLLIGKNGSGKSTLLRVISGLLAPDTGLILLKDQQVELSWSKQQKALRERVMYMHQSPYLFDGTVKRNLEYALVGRASSELIKQKLQEAIQWANLEALSDSPAKQLSGGEKQRVALARAWLRNASVLLLDEPTANLDRSSRLKTLELLASLKQSGVSLLIACHDYQEFNEISDGILELSNGSLQNIY